MECGNEWHWNGYKRVTIATKNKREMRTWLAAFCSQETSSDMGISRRDGSTGYAWFATGGWVTTLGINILNSHTKTNTRFKFITLWIRRRVCASRAATGKEEFFRLTVKRKIPASRKRTPKQISTRNVWGNGYIYRGHYRTSSLEWRSHTRPWLFVPAATSSTQLASWRTKCLFW